MNQETLQELLAKYPIKTSPVFLTGSPEPTNVNDFFRRWLEIYPDIKQIGQYVQEAIANLSY